MATTYPGRVDEARRLMGSSLGLEAIPIESADLVLVKNPAEADGQDATWVEYPGGAAATAFGV